MPDQQVSLAPSDEAGRSSGAAYSGSVAPAVPAPEVWQRFLWIRDRLRGRQNVLLMGRDVVPLAVLLVREGMRVTMLDSYSEGLVEAAGMLVEAEGGGAGKSHVVGRLDEISVQEALVAGGYDAAVILSGYRLRLPQLLSAMPAALVTDACLILVVPFGVQGGGDSGVVFPSTVVEALNGLSIDQLDVTDGVIRAVLQQRAFIGNLPGADTLLAMTEAGAAEELARLLRRLPVIEGYLEEARGSLVEAESQARELRESTSFQLGLALVTAIRSPGELLRLPIAIGRILSGRHRRPTLAMESRTKTGLTEWDKEALRNHVRQVIEQGPEAVIRAVDDFLPNSSPSLRGFAHLVAAQACGAIGRHDIEFEVACHALELNRSVGMLRGFLHVALRCREMSAASDTLREIHDAANNGSKVAKDFLKNFRQTSSYKIAVLEAIPPRPEQWAPVEAGRFVYVLHNSLPYSSGGYATRSHGVAVGLLERGYPVVCVTRPGFPLDIKRDLAPVDIGVVDVIDGVPYQRINEPGRGDFAEYRYVLAAADRLENELRRLKPAFVQGASNYVTGLPALVAARRLGVPFFYEVRGLWEITRMSRDEKFADSISFDVQRHIEGTVAREADHVFTLTEPMREELIMRGVEPERITLLPNSVDAERFQPRSRDVTLAYELDIPDGVPVIGYVGTFVVYEGLEQLAEACVQLHNRGHDFRLLLVGNENASAQDRGPITEEILRIAREGGIQQKLIMPGRIPHEQVEAYYSLIDICPFPRKPWPVCEMVSPMKPLEALAMKKAVVVSSVRALVEMIDDDVTGIVFEKGNVDSLSVAIEKLMQDPDKRARLGEAGREWVKRERSWNQIADKIDAVLMRYDAMRAEYIEMPSLPTLTGRRVGDD